MPDQFTAQALTDNERWLLSFYRTSEISGALFFGRLAKMLPPGPIQVDLTKHFADESQHAWFWTKCLDDLNLKPIKLDMAYQDQYLSAAGIPTNIMEVLSLTLIFEKRVIGQYALHRQAATTHPLVKQTIDRIVEDEKWHIDWVTKALKTLESEYSQEQIERTLKKFRDADLEVYQKTVAEHEEIVRGLIKVKTN